MLTIDPEQHVLFVGDVIGASGVEYLEVQLPHLKRDHQADLVVVNGENAHPGADGDGASGLGPREAARLFAAGVDVITGGNHSWDAHGATDALALPNVLRPLNAMPEYPGVGATVVVRSGIRYGVVNLASRTAIPSVAHPLPCLERQIEAWAGVVDAIVVDFHAASVSEKLSLAYAVAGRVSAVVGTHTHVPTADLRVLPGGTAYVTDVGMTGPEESLQGYTIRGPGWRPIGQRVR
jgi:2',3'-cyclic-nucleotide 2'-phosphodiesterase